MRMNLFDDLASASHNRERLTKKVDTATAVLGGGAPAATAEPITETDILNFALNL
jgi:hypothetical protein